MALSVSAQPVPARYGKIDMADLEMKVYDKDTTAEALILCDYGEFNPNSFDFTRLCRIKILKKEGTDFVNFVLSIEGQSQIKGCTYNLKDGQVVESKLKSESIFKERIREDLYRYRVTMPDVKVGSIVEIQYSFFLLPSEWRFQDRIPVRWSELRITDSPYVAFQKVFYGFQPLYINQPGRWVGKDMPALRPEPYMNSITNYITKVEIELANIMIPGRSKFYTSSWNAVNQYLLNNQYFGEALSAALFLTDEARQIREKNLSDLDKMKAACEMIHNKVKWNKQEELYTTADLYNAYRKGSGNSADVNLMLVQLLKKLDFEAFPIALSTRENGVINPAYATIDKLNYVVAGVKYNGKTFLFDATEPYLTPGMLPFRALNGRGRIINEKYSDWVDLTPAFDEKEVAYYDVKMDNNGEITGNVGITKSDYGAYYFRKEFKRYNSQEEYINELESDYPGLTINSASFEGIDSIYKPIKENYDISLTGNADVIGDMISFNPMFIERMTVNPFKMENRKYPVDYGHCIRKKYFIKIAIPENYEITDMPKPCNIQLPDKSARFTYQAAFAGNNIQLNVNFEISKTIFLENEYYLLREFYSQVIAKQAEVITIKKK